MAVCVALVWLSVAAPAQAAETRQVIHVVVALCDNVHQGIVPLLWTTGLMAPEAYVLKAAVDGWIARETGEAIRDRAAVAYNQYQKCGPKAARRLFATGW